MQNVFNVFGMTLLLVWSLGNIILGVKISRTSNKNSEHLYFWQMNIWWNIINGLIAAGALVSLYTQTSDSNSLLNILKLNSLLDIGYIVTGLLLSYFGKKKNSAMLKGYGKAVILQGAFLLCLDLALVYANILQ